MATVAKVAVQAATYAIDKVYDYLLPPELAGQVGCRVLVPFGRGNRLSEAVILPLYPDKGGCMTYDINRAASTYLEGDIELLKRMKSIH